MAPSPGGKTTTFYPAQANNAYIFPAVGHAAVLTRAKCIPEEVFLEAAACLAELSSDEDLACGKLFPSFSQIRPVSARIMARVCKYLCDKGFGQVPAGLVNGDWHALALASMYAVPQPRR